MTNGGGAGLLATDRAKAMGTRPPAPETVAAHGSVPSPHSSHGNPIDVPGVARADQFTVAIRAGFADPGSDGLLIVPTPQAVTDADEVARRAFAVPVGPTEPARDAKAAIPAAEDLGWPVAVKIDSPGISHESDVGGVRLGDSDGAELRAAFDAVPCRGAYPRHLRRDKTLPDGRGLTIRPIRPEDAQGEQAFARALSTEAKRLRLLGGLKALSPGDLAWLTQIDDASEMALVAVLPGEGWRQVGTARRALGPDDRTAAFAVVVDDCLRGQGIGTRPMTELMDAARGRGATRMVVDGLTGSRAMLTLMGEPGFAVRPDPSDRTMVRLERTP